MHERGRSGRIVMPVVGSAAAVVAGGALATTAEAAPAVPDLGDGALGALGGAPGTFESCEAYFGFGKELVAFDVVDQGGPDGVDHAVPTDTQVVFHLVNDEDEVLECTPVELTEEEWQEFVDGAPIPNLPAYPGTGHYVYPSLENGDFVDGFGNVESIGFRVVGFPGGHTLVSPTGVEPLLQSQVDGAELLFDGVVDPRVAAYLTDDASAAAAERWQGAVTGCADGAPFATGPDFDAAVASLEELTGTDVGADPTCEDYEDLNLNSSILLGLQESIAYTETITLALPAQATTTTTTAAVSPTSVGPTTTRVLARTGVSRSASLPVALLGAASIAGGALVLGARRRLTSR